MKANETIHRQISIKKIKKKENRNYLMKLFFAQAVNFSPRFQVS